MDDLRSAVAARVATTMTETHDRFAGVGGEIDDLFTVSAPLLARGKRLRAAFLAAGWRVFSGEPLAAAEVRAGSGLEIFQLAALVHDDLMDGSLTRRGLPASHRRFTALHEERGMISDPEHFGAAGAILLGDLLLVAASADLHAAIALLDPARYASSAALVETMMAEVTIGQYLDIYAQSAPWSDDPAVELDRARRVIRSKSARYSVEYPLRLGAAMAGASAAESDAIGTVGLPIGEAFQLRDDVLGVFGDPHVTGKPAGDDLREGKRTVLVTLGMTLAGPAERDTLRRALGRADLGPAEVDRVRRILTDTGAQAQVEELIAERLATGRAAIDALGADPEDAARLRHLADAAVTRTH
nr:polyprenyl synthetase family protein [Pseudactinotalea sp. HY160]